MLAPGNSPGIMNIDGDLILNDGVLQLEADSILPADRDLLNVSGTVFFGDDVLIEDFFGTGSVFDFGTGFDPAASVMFSFADGVQVSEGDIFGYSLGGQEFEYTYGSSPVPLPTSAFLLMTGLLGVLRMNTRHRHNAAA